MPPPTPITIFGEVLYDCFPDGSEVLGGAPFNVAWHLRGFALAPCLISRVGMDAQGERIRAAMEAWGLDDSFLQTDPDHPTGRVSVIIEHDEPSYDIVADSAYDFIAAEDLAEVPTNGLLYHGSLALRHPASASALAKLKADHRGKIFLDVNLRAPWWSRETILPLLDDADHVKLNEAELSLLSAEGHAEDDVEGLGNAMDTFASRHRIETLIVTRGAKGALLWNAGTLLSAAPASGITVVDTVGAGDGFASVILLGLSRQWPLSLILDHARDFATALVSQRGAIIDDPAVYQQFLKTWSKG
jgi:fructokinase